MTTPKGQWWRPWSWEWLREIRLRGPKQEDVTDFSAIALSVASEADVTDVEAIALSPIALSVADWEDVIVAYTMNSWPDEGHKGPGGLAGLN